MTEQSGVLAGTPSALVTEQTVRNRATFILEELKGQPPGVVLDAGCGLGVYLRLLSQSGSRAIGIDIGEDYLRQAREIVSKDSASDRMHLALTSVERMGFPNETFDAIICIENLEHVTDDEMAVKEFRRVLKPGGRLIISVPNKWFLFETHGVRVGSKVISSPFGLGIPFLPLLPSRLRRLFATARVYSPRHLKNLLERNNFKPTTIRFLMPSLDIFERKTQSVKALMFPITLLRKTLMFLQDRLSKVWGSTVIISGQAR
jgi:2-polyprenyl-3-methyl-5-hydroxy-6-metoxy-1,4-benzoquinol methylase